MEKQLRQQIEQLPKNPGVYLYRDETGNVLYVGKAVDIRNRVRSYFQNSANLGPKTNHMVGQISSIEHFETESEFTALLLEADLIKRLKPKYNQRFKDDKSYPLIEFTKEKYPRVQVTRKKGGNAEYFGPYPHGNIRKVLKLLRRSFPFRSCSDSKFNRYKKMGRGCLYEDIDLCPAPCVKDTITEDDYKKSLKGLRDFLKGKGSEVKNELEKEMEKLSKLKKYEEAAKVRDQLDNLKYIRRGFRTATEEELDINLPEDRQRKQMEALQAALNLPNSPKRIEAYDISNLQGKEATGSMVVFENARPKKSHYRRFKIRMENEPDDVGMMKEVLERRFSRIQKRTGEKGKKLNFKDRPAPPKRLGEGGSQSLALENSSPAKSSDQSFQSIPDLILIDGGKGQLTSAVDVLQEKGLAIPTASLAKREEEIYYASPRNKVGSRSNTGRGLKTATSDVVAKFTSRKEEAKQALPLQKKESGLTTVPQDTTRQESAARKEKSNSTKISGPISLPKTSPALKLLQKIRDESHRFALAYHQKLRSNMFE